MALSVSGFPEPSKSPASAEPTADDGHKNLMNSPRLRSLFGKKHDSRFKSDIDQEGGPGSATPTTSPSSTPPTTSTLPAFIQQTYIPSPEEYDIPIHMPVPLDSRAIMSRRPQPLPPIPIPRRATASPVRIQPSLTRLDIGAISKQHPVPKPPPAVVIEQWSNNSSSTSSLGKAAELPPRPLPQPPPAVAAEASKPKHVHVHVNAVAGPSRLPHGHNQTPTNSSGSARARSHSRSRMQPQGKGSVAMRYQAMSVELSEKARAGAASQSANASSSAIASSSTSTVASTSASSYASGSGSRSSTPAASGSGSSSSVSASTSAAAATSPIRPLPTLPAPQPVSAILRTAPVAGPSSSRYIPPTPRVKRPRTSPGPAQVGRSVFDASRPIDLNASVLAPSRPIVLPQHKPQPLMHSTSRSSSTLRGDSKASPMASGSRPRREHSADSYLGKDKGKGKATMGGRVMMTGSPRAPVPVPRIQTNRPTQRTLPSPVIGARPMPVRSTTLDNSRISPGTPPKLTIQTTNALRRSPVSPPSSDATASASGSGSSASKSGSSASASAGSRLGSRIDTHVLAYTSTKDTKELDYRPPRRSSLSLDASNTLHPIAHAELSPTAESPLEVYVDDMDMTSFSRSPSPITYARPNSRGTVISSDEETRSSSSPTVLKRTQPRSYRNSYRHPQPPSPPPLSRSPSPILYARRRSFIRPEDGDLSPTVEKRRTQPRSFQYDPAGPMAPHVSPPSSRPASPERRSRSRVPKGKKDKERDNDKEREKDKGYSKSRSPRRRFRSTVSVPATPAKTNFESEPFVLDISLRAKAQSKSIPNSLKSTKRPGTSGSGSGSVGSGSSKSGFSIGGGGGGRSVFVASLSHRRVASAAVAVASTSMPSEDFDPYTHGASCGIGMLRAAELSNSSGMSRASGSSSSAKGTREGKERERGRREERGRGRRHTQIVQQHRGQQQRQRVNSTTAYEEFFSSLRRKEQKVKDDIALVDLGLHVDKTGVVTGLQSSGETGWREEGTDPIPRLTGLKTKSSR